MYIYIHIYIHIYIYTYIYKHTYSLPFFSLSLRRLLSPSFPHTQPRSLPSGAGLPGWMMFIYTPTSICHRNPGNGPVCGMARSLNPQP